MVLHMDGTSVLIATQRTKKNSPSSTIRPVVSQQTDGLRTRKRTWGQLIRDESPDERESPDLESEVK